MFERILVLAAVTVTTLLLVTTAVAQSSSTTLSIDSDRSKITWVSEAPAEKIVGTAAEVEGKIRWNLDKLEATSAKISFPVASMKTGNSLRDRHLQGKDWLNAKKNPKITFEVKELTDVKRSQDGDRVNVEATAVGEVTVNGVNAPGRAQVEIAVLPAKKLARVQPKLSIDLDDFEVEGRRGSIGKEVAETIEIEGVLYGEWK